MGRSSYHNFNFWLKIATIKKKVKWIFFEIKYYFNNKIIFLIRNNFKLIVVYLSKYVMPVNNMSEQINKLPLGALFRRKREEKGLLIRQVAAVTELDQAIISRIENGERSPTKEQVLKLAGLYNLDIKETMSAWLAEKMIRDYGDEPFISEALREAHNHVLYNLTMDPGFSSVRGQKLSGPMDEPGEHKNPKRKRGRPPGKTNQ